MNDLDRKPVEYKDFVPTSKVQEMEEEHKKAKEAISEDKAIDLYKKYRFLATNETFTLIASESFTGAFSFPATAGHEIIVIDLFKDGNAWNAFDLNGYSSRCKSYHLVHFTSGASFKVQRSW